MPMSETAQDLDDDERNGSRFGRQNLKKFWMTMNERSEVKGMKIVNNEESIGIFDSGIGGVTVLKEIIKILPNENYKYYSDSKNNPYGDKTDEEIIKICDKIVSNFIKQKCKAIVIACNTASAKAAKTLREKYPEIPIIAIEPAYKMVHDFANDKVFAKMKQRHSDMKGFGLRAILSSLVGETVDSSIFIPIAFFNTMPFETMLWMGVVQVCLKVTYEIVILPITKF